MHPSLHRWSQVDYFQICLSHLLVEIWYKSFFLLHFKGLYFLARRFWVKCIWQKLSEINIKVWSTNGSRKVEPQIIPINFQISEISHSTKTFIPTKLLQWCTFVRWILYFLYCSLCYWKNVKTNRPVRFENTLTVYRHIYQMSETLHKLSKNLIIILCNWKPIMCNKIHQMSGNCTNYKRSV